MLTLGLSPDMSMSNKRSCLLGFYNEIIINIVRKAKPEIHFLSQATNQTVKQPYFLFYFSLIIFKPAVAGKLTQL